MNNVQFAGKDQAAHQLKKNEYTIDLRINARILFEFYYEPEDYSQQASQAKCKQSNRNICMRIEYAINN
jgi:hypothetical protein